MFEQHFIAVSPCSPPRQEYIYQAKVLGRTRRCTCRLSLQKLISKSTNWNRGSFYFVHRSDSGPTVTSSSSPFFSLPFSLPRMLAPSRPPVVIQSDQKRIYNGIRFDNGSQTEFVLRMFVEWMNHYPESMVIVSTAGAAAPECSVHPSSDGRGRKEIHEEKFQEVYGTVISRRLFRHRTISVDSIHTTKNDSR